MLSSAAKRWSRTRSTSAAGAVSASSASDVAVTATCSLVPSVWAACARSATAPCSLMTCSERGCSLPLESTASRESAWTCRSARAELGKPLRGLPHGPHRGCYDGVVLPRFQSSRKSAGVYHDHHPDTAADAALPVPVLSRQNPDICPSFIPAFTSSGIQTCTVRPCHLELTTVSRYVRAP